MITRPVSSLALCAALLSTPAFAGYKLADDYTGREFFNKFDYFSAPDPTEGNVQYLDQTSAIKSQLVGFLEDNVVAGGEASVPSVLVGVDYTNKVDDLRPSVRLTSKNTYDTGLLIIDILHMPANADGIWPAFWLLGNASGTIWPESGEIDIVEGVHQSQHNAITLHTSAGCAVSTGEQHRAQYSGELDTPNCDVKAEGQDDNVGCSIKMEDSDVTGPAQANYGKAFNDNGGGTYAVEWTNEGIKAWFFPRPSADSSTTRPASLLSMTPDVNEFGTPVADFSGDCDFAQKFQKQQIILNTAFCGAWAGAVWDSSGAAERTGVATCEEYVRNTPEAFMSAYWEIRSLRVFVQEGSEGPTAATAKRALKRDETEDGRVHTLPIDLERPEARAAQTERRSTSHMVRSQISKMAEQLAPVYTSAAEGASKLDITCAVAGMTLLVAAWLL